MQNLAGLSRGLRLRIGAGLLLALLVLAGMPAQTRAQSTPGIGAGIFEVHGTSDATFDLGAGGTYDLIMAPDGPSAFVDARLLYNGTLTAELNESAPTATLVSLTAGNYTIRLAGQGRAALGWDFTDGSVQDFPDNAIVTTFLRPDSPHLDVVVSMGNAQEVRILVYGDDLRLVTETNVTTSGAVGVNLPAAHATFALLVASVVTGNPHGVFGLAWSSPSPPASGPDLASQVLVAAVWIAVPVVLALLVFLVLRRRGGPR